MLAEVMPFDKDAYIARRSRLGLNAPKPKTVKIVKETSVKDDTTFYLRHDVYLHNSPPPPLDESILIPAEKWKVIFQEVCDKHNVPPVLIRGKQRAPYIVKARHEIAYRLVHETTMSLPQIASKMGYECHTTLYNCIEKYKKAHGIA